MSAYYRDEHVSLYHGDCLDVLAELPESSVHAVVTDPPYAIAFMGRAWDAYDTPVGFQTWCTQWARECLRVLQPGGHLLSFGSTRTWHRLAVAVEDAGFEMRDSIAWLYGSGFPKSHDVTDAMERHLAGEQPAPAPAPPAEMYAVTRFLRAARDAAGWSNRDIDALFGTNGMAGHWTSSGAQPACPSLRQWAVLQQRLGFGDDFDELVTKLAATERPPDGGGRDGAFLATLHTRGDGEPAGGWGTALKPAFEPIVVARKPLDGTVAANVQEFGTGALNIDGCRVGNEARPKQASTGKLVSNNSSMAGGNYSRQIVGSAAGRWPTNVVLDDTAAAELDEQSGVTKSTSRARGSGMGYHGGDQERGVVGPDDSGGASRFFPVFRWEPKAPPEERPCHEGMGHPTCKPVGLLRWLCRLVCPPGATVLDPFAGSGTTMQAARAGGFDTVGIEREADYLPLIKQRLARVGAPVHTNRWPGHVDQPGQVSMFDLLGGDAA